MNRDSFGGSKSTKWAAIFIGLAGVIHLVITPQHWAHAPAHGLFFIIVGLAEIGWSLAILLRPSQSIYRIGIVLAVLLISLWAIIRLLPAPFGHGPERVEPFGVVCKFAEGLGTLVLGMLVFQELSSAVGRRAAWRALTLLVIVGLLGGGITYGVARAAEPIFPFLKASVEAHHDHEHTHEHEATPEPTHEHEHKHEATPEPTHEHPHEMTPEPTHEHAHEATPEPTHEHEATSQPAEEHHHEMTPTPTHEHYP